MTRTVAIYCRISRDRVGAGLGVERQETDCRELAERLGWTVVAVHVDNDLSAYSGKPRPGYRALLADVAAERIEAVIAWHNDRLHRSAVELEEYIDVCGSIPTRFVKAGELDLSNASGRMIARITGAVAHHEVEHMIERIRSEKSKAARAGKYRGGRRPFGYEADGLTPRPGEAAAVLDASHRVLHGESLASVAREWNARGVLSASWHPPLTATVWTPVSLRQVLLRARNAGIIEHEKQEIARASWPAIVPEPVWCALRVMCADPARRAARSVEPRWLGSGLFRCGVCGESTVRSGSGGSARPIYRCKAATHLVRAIEPVDAFVTAVVLARLSRPDARLLLRPDPKVDIEALSAEAAALRVRQGELVGLFSDGVISRSEVAEGKDRIGTRLAELATLMVRATAGSSLAGFADAHDVAEAWRAASVGRRKAVTDALMTVTLHSPGRGVKTFDPATVQIEWRQE